MSALWNYFVSELRQSASQNLSKKDGAVKTATFFSERFCESDWRKFRNKEAAHLPPWLTDGIDGRCLCTLIFSVATSSVGRSVGLLGSFLARLAFPARQRKNVPGIPDSSFTKP